MKNRDLSAAICNGKKNILPTASAIAALCLFLSPSLLCVLLTAAAFAAVLLASAVVPLKPCGVSAGGRRAAAVSALLMVLWRLQAFCKVWAPSGLVGAIADKLGISISRLLLGVGVMGCVAGIYAVYCLICWGVILTEKATAHLNRKKNWKSNWYFPLSALAFFVLSVTFTGGSLLAVITAVGGCALAALVNIPFRERIRKTPVGIQVISLLSALGICMAAFDAVYAQWSVTARMQAEYAGVPETIPGWLCGSLAVMAVPFAYVCLVIFWNRICRIFGETGCIRNMGKGERLVWGLLMAAMLTFMTVCFLRSEAFYGTEHAFDIIYTSDSPILVRENIYLALNHPENDLRQPLFAVFAAPFAGLPYFLGRVLDVSEPVQAVLTNSVQVVLLFVACGLLADMLKLKTVNRICFLLLSCCTYNHLLFVLMMEQYLVAYFWLIFCVYLIVENRGSHREVLWGAGGSLLTSVALTPFLSQKPLLREWKGWLLDMVRYGLEFVTVMLVFGRLDVISNMTSKMSALSRFTGRELTFLDKVFQYTAFVHDCFAAPDAGISTVVPEHISWQLNMPQGIHPVGVAILVLVVVSALWNRKEKTSRIAICWVAFSAVMLLGLGWGTQENGLILYALYFGWAFLALLIQLVEKIGHTFRIPFLLPAVSIAAAAGLAVVNIPGILEMVRFAIRNFPV